MTAAYRSGDWWNKRLENALERARPVFERWMDTYLADGVPMGYKPVTWSLLMKMPPEQAVEEVAAMIRNPQTAADGVKYLRMMVGRELQNASDVQSYTR